jgi:hypothetical protein
MDGESLLGPLPEGWKLELVFEDGSYTPTYVNTSTEHRYSEDPRLPPLDSNWAKITRQRTQDDPHFLQWFRNEDRGQVMNSDPRLLPETLIKRGVALEYFKLV